MRLSAVILTTALATSPLAHGKTEATGLVQFEYGQSFPQNELTSYFSPGDAYRLRLFGGAKIKLGAVGLGWDITYANYGLKDGLSGHYNRLLWDWLFLPVGIGFIQLTPGLAWVVTDVDVSEMGLKEQSIRPAGVLSIGVKLGIISNVAITAQVRGESVWEDMEPVVLPNQDEIDITGQFVTATVGGMLYF
ncbi:hypothetical protein [Pseudobacteriovorax antillogorgiicola]|uniref:Outer membrane protein beta-barrel domain-containing protein n=1 Tax=Pseudobacteriovorax antillogorgiicola TaxID=1513793 RepID=A0A1Y6BI59_9BACT|nr:hypothetical protein [Pseudobacteriovorax antillogorgiicola]TCS56482.1 hypothetical protein EDD56_104304 [Pseudobacteriovorax antillogorgiicola]SMF04932.1 hypothetical protein SAMN06296036_10429 [Pseudobacteriovorax antillogorgiicola]